LVQTQLTASIQLNDGTTPIDHIFVSRFGVFVIETKDYNGWIFANANQEGTRGGRFQRNSTSLPRKHTMTAAIRFLAEGHFAPCNID